MVDEEIFVTKLEHVDEFLDDLEEMRACRVARTERIPSFSGPSSER